MTPLARGFALCWPLLLLGSAQGAELTGGPMLGFTDHRSTRVWARADGEGTLAVRLRAVGETDWRTSPPVAFRPDAGGTAQVTLEGLRPRTDYEYTLLVDGAPLAGGPWRFHTLPPPGAGKLRLAFGSCAHLQRFPEQPIWKAIAAAHPDVFVWLGDNCYYTQQDCEQPELMWERMRAQRECSSMQPFLSTIPSVAQWDDHDFGPNDSDRTFVHKGYAREVFRAYWANPSYGEDDEGIYGRVQLGPVDLFLLDDRWFRDPDRQPDDGHKTFLGERQRTWLVEGLAGSRAPLKVVASATQFLADYHPFESWQEAASERAWILDRIREAKVQGVLFISGDRHMCEALRWKGAGPGYDLWDLTSSPLANRTVGEALVTPNPRREFAEGEGHNFGWVEVDADAGTVRLELRDEAGQTLWSATPDLRLKARKHYY